MTTAIEQRTRDHAYPFLKGESAEARLLDDQRVTARASSPSLLLDWKDFLKDRVEDVFASCQERDWDCYGADPISPAARAGALDLIDLLPDDIQPPEVGPEPDGKLALEWERGNDLIFSISVEGNRLVYAGFFDGESCKSGKEDFGDYLPYAIEQALLLHFAKD